MDAMVLLIAPFLPTLFLLAIVFKVLHDRKKKEMAANEKADGASSRSGQ